MHRVNLMDVSGLHMLETVVRLYREQEGDVYLTGVRREVLAKLEGGGFVDVLGRDHFLPQERAIAHLFYKILDPAQCIYHCRVRVWRECQSLPKSTRDRALPHIPSQHEVPRISAESLYHVMLDEPETLVIDVRESAEYASGHIPGALLWPLPRILDGDTPPFNGRVAYITCRTSRRSVRASQTIFEQSGVDIPIVEGGMLAWEEAGLPEVIE
jgi:SulP family sulfate permease